MNERDIEALKGLEPGLNLALQEIEMRDYFHARIGISDVTKPELWSTLLGDEGPDCD